MLGGEPGHSCLLEFGARERRGPWAGASLRTVLSWLTGPAAEPGSWGPLVLPPATVGKSFPSRASASSSALDAVVVQM